MNNKCDAAIDARDDHRAALLERKDAPFQYISGAQSVRAFRCQQNVSGADCYLDAASSCGVAKRHLDFARTFSEANAHDAVGLAKIEHGCCQQILEAGSLRQFLPARRVQDIHWGAGTHHTPIIERDDALAESL